MFKNQKNKLLLLSVLLLVAFGLADVLLNFDEVLADRLASGFAQPDLTNIDLEKSEKKVEANGIIVRLTKAFQNGDHFQVNLCYTLPDDRDWLLVDKGNEVFLKVKGQAIHPIEEGTIAWIFTADGVKSERCEYLLFPTVVDKGITGLGVTITQLSVSQPEVLDCPAIQKRLDDAKSNLAIECVREEGTSGFNILKKPVGMNELDARELVHKVVVDARSGPWEFEIGTP